MFGIRGGFAAALGALLATGLLTGWNGCGRPGPGARRGDPAGAVAPPVDDGRSCRLRRSPPNRRMGGR